MCKCTEHTKKPEQRAKEFRSSNGADQSKRDIELAGIMFKLLSQQSAPDADIDEFDSSTLELTISHQNLRRYWLEELLNHEADQHVLASVLKRKQRN